MSDSGVHRRRVRLRLTLTFAALAAVWSAICGGLALELSADAAERATAETLAPLAQRVEPELSRIGGELTSSLERLAQRLRHEPTALARLLAGGPVAVAEGARLGAATELDLLTFLDDRDAVLWAGHWPELAGLREPSLGPPWPGRPTVRRVGGPQGDALFIVLRRPLESGGRRGSVVGGRRLDARLLAAIAPGQPALLLDLAARGARAAIVGADGPHTDLPAWVALARGDEGPAPSIAGSGGGAGWLAARRTLADGQGHDLAAVVVGVERRGVPAGLRDWLWTAGLLTTVLAAAAGAWSGSRIARPVDRLVRAVDAIAAGDADYTFAAPPEHELGRLAQAFSRLERSLELQRRRAGAAERLAAWREAARRVAHEVKNPLVPIRLTVENLARARRESPQRFDELFEEGSRTILEEVDQLGRLVSEFSEFARLPLPRPRPVDLHELIEGTLELHGAEPGLAILRSYTVRPPRPEVDRDQFGRALRNVVGNAVEAMRGGRRPPVLEVLTVLYDDGVGIEIADSGPGLPPGCEARIFEPYFTTRVAGSGLGLAIAQRIVLDHGGTIEAQNRPEGGARVRIRLPLPAGAPAEGRTRT